VAQKAAADAAPAAAQSPPQAAPPVDASQAAASQQVQVTASQPGPASQQAPAPQPVAQTPPTTEAPAVIEHHEATAEILETHDPNLVGVLSGCDVRCGVMCGPCDPCTELTWDAMAPIPWESLAHGEYIGPARLPHVPEYRLRVDDVIEFVYRLTRTPSLEPYRINVGDTLRIESLTAESLNREVIVQPDGTITVGNISQVGPDRTTTTGDIGQVPAAGRTIEELRNDLVERYKPTIAVPSITVTPITLDSRLEELRATVDARAGSGGQGRSTRVTPEGTVQLPAIGSVPAQGLTLDELKFEIEQRYNEIVVGLEITPILAERAPRFVYVTGEVGQPGRYELVAPTTLIQAIAMAGSWNVGADLENIVILRRDENWQLMATKVNLHYALFGHKPCPAGEIWLRDSDIVLLPKHPLLWTDDLIELLFTRGLYGVFPVSYSVVFNRASTL
jgi:polysaccharide export outer membrane protein